MPSHLNIEELTIHLTRKSIKHVYLRVRPPDGAVHISAPRRMPAAQIEAFAHSKLSWIRRKQAKLRQTASRPAPRYTDGEIHPVWGDACTLTVSQADSGKPSVEKRNGRLHLRARPETDAAERAALLEAFYRAELEAALPALLKRWQPVLGVVAARISLRRMKTRWGSCTPDRRTVRINLELAKHPPEWLEYVLVHELVHLLEPSHNARFKALMDRFLPDWRRIRKQLREWPPGAH